MERTWTTDCEGNRQNPVNGEQNDSVGRTRRVERYQSPQPQPVIRVASRTGTEKLKEAKEALEARLAEIKKSYVDVSKSGSVLEKGAMLLRKAAAAIRAMHLKERGMKAAKGISAYMGDLIAKQKAKGISVKPGGFSAVLLIGAAVMLLLALIGAVSAGQLNRELQQSGMGFLSIDEAIEALSSMAKYTGRSIGDYMNGANAFILFTVMKRKLLAVAGILTLAIGIVLTRVNSRQGSNG